MKLKDAGVQAVGPLTGVTESVQTTGAPSSYRPANVVAQPPGCDSHPNIGSKSLPPSAPPETLIQCPCCSLAPKPGTGWGSRFVANPPVPFDVAALGAQETSIWRIEGPSFRGALPEQDHTVTLSPVFDDRPSAMNWLNSADGQYWSADAIGVWLTAHIY
jgi:hypothetical protein